MGLLVLTVDYWLMAHVQTIDKFKLFFFNTGLSSVYTLDNFTEQCSTKKSEVLVLFKSLLFLKKEFW